MFKGKLSPLKRDLAEAREIFKEFYLFFKQNKKWWLLPLMFSLIILGFILIFIQTSALAPFIYTIF